MRDLHKRLGESLGIPFMQYSFGEMINAAGVITERQRRRIAELEARIEELESGSKPSD